MKTIRLIIKLDKPDEEFWEYEWMKHGTCGISIDRLDSSTKFFNQALAWLELYNMTSILATSNIVPDNQKSYELNEIHGAVKKVLNRNPSIQCFIDGDEQYLNEIRICFNRDLNLIDCDGIDKRTNKDNIGTNCRNKPINYRNDFVEQTSGWFNYAACVGVLIFIVVAVILMKNTNLRQRLSRNTESTRLF